eukprot:6584140-Pyramimonas_sp.AAC.1
MEGLRRDGWEPELFTLVLGTLGEIPFEAVSVLETLGVRGQEEMLCHEELSGLSEGGVYGTRKRKAKPPPEKTLGKKAKELLEQNDIGGRSGFRPAVRKKRRKRRK